MRWIMICIDKEDWIISVAFIKFAFANYSLIHFNDLSYFQLTKSNKKIFWAVWYIKIKYLLIQIENA